MLKSECLIKSPVLKWIFIIDREKINQIKVGSIFIKPTKMRVYGLYVNGWPCK